MPPWLSRTSTLATPRNATKTTSSLTEGLYLLVRSNGSKLWRFKYRFGGKEKLLSFGDYPRDKLPIVTTFEEAARASHANRLASFDEGHAWTMFRGRDRCPLASWSWTKFSLQRWFDSAGTRTVARPPMARLRPFR